MWVFHCFISFSFTGVLTIISCLYVRAADFKGVEFSRQAVLLRFFCSNNQTPSGHHPVIFLSWIEFNLGISTQIISKLKPNFWAILSKRDILSIYTAL